MYMSLMNTAKVSKNKTGKVKDHASHMVHGLFVL
jgi:hypothetical protein